MKACFMGLGYIGLPTAIIAAKHGIEVTGVDINPGVVELTNRGKLHIVEPGMEGYLQEVVKNGRLKASLKPEVCEAYFMVVPTPFKGNHEPDISYVEAATRSVLSLLKAGDLYVIESTSPIGTTEKMRDLIYGERPELKDKIYIAYCPERVLPGNVIYELVHNIEGHGPSTDGIDIDSSEYILVQNANINCNDDNFCLKAGRDSDGLRVNRPCQYVVIRDCVAGSGGGMFTCGSETSGGIRNIVAYRMKGVGTKCGLRFKSTCQRGGVIEDIYLYDIEMIGVERPFVVDLNWNPAYSISKLPKGYDMEKIPVYWSKMLESVSLEQGTPVFRNVTLDNVTASNARTCMNVVGIANSKIENFILRNVCIEGNKAGKIIWAKDWKLDDVQIKAHDELILEYNENVDMP